MGILGTLINGNMYDFSSLKVTTNVLGAPPLIERFTSLTYEHSMSVGKFRGRGSKVLGTTRGEYDASGSIVMYIEDWLQFQAGLTAQSAAGGGGWMMTRFMINVAYAEVGSAIVNDVLRGCRITKTSKSLARGTDPIMVTLDLDIMEIIENAQPAVVDGSNALSVL